MEPQIPELVMEPQIPELVMEPQHRFQSWLWNPNTDSKAGYGTPTQIPKLVMEPQIPELVMEPQIPELVMEPYSLFLYLAF
jgi:hypothetical protein